MKLAATDETVAALPDPTNTKALVAAGVVQVQTVFVGAAVAALVGAAVSLGLGLRRGNDRPQVAVPRP